MAHTRPTIVLSLHERGFTLIELMWILSITGIIFGFVVINLLSASQSSTLLANMSTLVTDIKQQQFKAMMGDAQKTATPSSYGVHFDQNQYVLFKGNSYSANNPANIAIAVQTPLKFTTPSAELLFAQLTGELTVASSQAILDTSTGTSRTILMNRYGVVTNVQ